MIFHLLLIVIGLFLWWAMFGTECAMNGAIGGWTMPFKCLIEDIKDGFTIDGKLHAFGTHIVLPLMPLAVYYTIKGIGLLIVKILS